MLSEKVKTLFDSIIDAILCIFIILLVIGIDIGTIQLVLSFTELLKFQDIIRYYNGLIADLLTLFVFIELFRSLVEYSNTHRSRLTSMIDATMNNAQNTKFIKRFKNQKYFSVYSESSAKLHQK